jgi:tetrahydromethanopterin S-methyltransferase subunit G
MKVDKICKLYLDQKNYYERKGRLADIESKVVTIKRQI